MNLRTKLLAAALAVGSFLAGDYLAYHMRYNNPCFAKSLLPTCPDSREPDEGDRCKVDPKHLEGSFYYVETNPEDGSKKIEIVGESEEQPAICIANNEGFTRTRYSNGFPMYTITTGHKDANLSMSLLGMPLELSGVTPWCVFGGFSGLPLPQQLHDHFSALECSLIVYDAACNEVPDTVQVMCPDKNIKISRHLYLSQEQGELTVPMFNAAIDVLQESYQKVPIQKILTRETTMRL